MAFASGWPGMMLENGLTPGAPPKCAASRSTADRTPGARNAIWTKQVSSTMPRLHRPSIRGRGGGRPCRGGGCRGGGCRGGGCRGGGCRGGGCRGGGWGGSCCGAGNCCVCDPVCCGGWSSWAWTAGSCASAGAQNTQSAGGRGQSAGACQPGGRAHAGGGSAHPGGARHTQPCTLISRACRISGQDAV